MGNAETRQAERMFQESGEFFGLRGTSIRPLYVKGSGSPDILLIEKQGV